MCCHNSLKKIYIFSAAFLIGILAATTYQFLNSNTKTQNILTDESLIARSKQSRKSMDKDKPSGFSEKRKTEADERNSCLNYCRVCKCEVNISNKRPETFEAEVIDSTNSKPLKILNKPKPKYTEEARNNNIQGTVRVRVTFLSSGAIDSVKEVAGLPFGLTKRAIEAAKKIKFKPQTVNGKPVAVTKVVAYTFTNH